jgi:hypothetical protein
MDTMILRMAAPSARHVGQEHDAVVEAVHVGELEPQLCGIDVLESTLAGPASE